MTRAEQEAFEKWMKENDGFDTVWVRTAFLAGYRAGFERGYYHIANPDEFTGDPDDA